MEDNKRDDTLSERLLSDDVEQPIEDLMMNPGQIEVDPLQAGRGFRGESQQPEYRDAPFAIGFVAHLLVILSLAFVWGTSSMKVEYASDGGDTPEDPESTSLKGLLLLCLLTSLACIGISAAALELMTRHAEQLIQLSLVASCVLMGFMVVAFFASGAAYVGFFQLFFLVLTVLYAYSVWNRIPFAAANLTTGLEAIKTNYGVCVLGYVLAFAANVWVLVWVLAVSGVVYKESNCEDNVCNSHMDPISAVLFLLSFYWTSQVLKNVLHVTIAGVVGTWWFAPQDANSVFSPAIQDSFRRATTYSFGSICMGSLLVAIIQTLRAITDEARRRNGGIMLCILECILYYIERIAKYFNKWNMIYVGLYGYDYLTAGKKVLALFQERGWTSIINDNLVYRTLMLATLVIAGLTGLVGMLLAKISGWATVALGVDNHAGVFFTCFLIGLSLAAILMSVVLSAVDTVIVSFAEAPGEFETNHPTLSQQLRTAWRQVYPDECGF